MVFINEGQTSQTQQANQEVILLTQQAVERLLEMLFMLAQPLSARSEAEPEAAEEEIPLTPDQQAKATDLIASASGLSMDAFTLNESTGQLECNYASDAYQMKVEMGEKGDACYSISDAHGQLCLYATKSADKPLSIDHLSRDISPEQLNQWSSELEAMKGLNEHPTKDMQWVKECHQQAPTWCPAGTSAIMVSDQVLTYQNTDTFYSDKTGLTFARTEDKKGITMTRNDGSIACQFGPQGIVSNLTPDETTYFRNAHQQYIHRVAAKASVSATPVQQTNGAAKASKGFERTPFE